jgi:hypothetical protein
LSVVLPPPPTAVAVNRRVNPITAARARLDVALPVHNEERVLEASLRRLHSHLGNCFPFATRITVADSASTDRTIEVARRLAAELPGVRVLHLWRRGAAERSAPPGPRATRTSSPTWTWTSPPT